MFLNRTPDPNWPAGLFVSEPCQSWQVFRERQV
jgi:hypothetical protein